MGLLVYKRRKVESEPRLLYQPGSHLIEHASSSYDAELVGVNTLLKRFPGLVLRESASLAEFWGATQPWSVLQTPEKG